MLVKDLCKVSYATMRFRDYKSHELIYEFTWEDDDSENTFIDKYGECIITKITSCTADFLNVYIIITKERKQNDKNNIYIQK